MDELYQKNPSKPPARDPLPIVAASVALVTLATIALVWFFVETLQENSKKMHFYQVQTNMLKKNKDVDEINTGDMLVASFDEKEKLHSRSLATKERAEELKNALQFKSAAELFKRCAQQYEKERTKSQPIPDDVRFVAGVHWEAARCFYSARDYRSSLLELNLAIANEPGAAAFYKDRASVFRLLGQEREARADLERMRQCGSNQLDPAELMRTYDRSP